MKALMDNVGIRDDLRCKRSDGKQWRCTALSMPDKTVCEKHYYQAKKRAANSAIRASMKKANTSSIGEYSISLPNSLASPNSVTSEATSESSEGQPCHHCQRNDWKNLICCLKCQTRGYCETCISTWYSNIPFQQIQRVCPACRGNCTCKLCLRADNLIKIHHDQCFEVELEKKLRGKNIDLVRAKLNADEQMCCDLCRIPIIDYHRHCPNCSYDLCLSCCREVREASPETLIEDAGNQIPERNDEREGITVHVQSSNSQPNHSIRFPGWKVNSDGSVPCPSKEYGGCGCSFLTLKRIFKMNWVAKLVKNVEEMASGCRVHNSASSDKNGFDLRLLQAANREKEEDNFLYRPSSQDIRNEGIRDFRMHWSKGEPIIVKEVCDMSSMSIWDPLVILKAITETSEEEKKDDRRTVKAVDCFDFSEVNIELGQFIKGYAEGRVRENGWPEMLKLKDWPSPVASEEFLMYQRPDFISKLPLIEFIHSKWGLLNVAAKLPHYSLQNDVGPKIHISYGTYEELGKGDSVDNIHVNMRDMVFLLVHICEVKLNEWQRTKIKKIKQGFTKSENLEEGESPILSPNGDVKNDFKARSENHELTQEQHTGGASTVDNEDVQYENLNTINGDNFGKSCPGALWDIFRRQDIPKLIDYLKSHWKEVGNMQSATDQSVYQSLYSGVIYLNEHQKMNLKEEFGVEPWSFEQHVGEALFIPAGCPYQVRNLQSTVQLGLDFLSPESLGEAARLAEEIRGLPNDHEAKLQILELMQVGKISLYAASSAIKDVQKLVLDSKTGPELGFEDPNLTALVSENLEKMTKRKQIACG
ncbi:hypothetical protein Leryth_016078 [Lithospermum erythrorhizon]|nr:hypothetical protein Leryth_016078 [Lithospermum erythrorhizon]